MAFLKFNKAELVNLEYSLKREILGANSCGAYFNTSIIGCNTRKYHGLMVAPVAQFNEAKFVLLSTVEDSIILNGKKFNLGINCYGDVYEPKGHKYIIDFDADNVPELTYKVGPVTIRKSIVMAPDKDQVMISYTLVSAPGKVRFMLKPFLAFRGIHTLTQENGQACTDFNAEPNGASFCMYDGFPRLYVQTSVKSSYRHQPYWYKGITYSNEYRRGFDCREDLLVPGTLELELKPEESFVLSASLQQETVTRLKTAYSSVCKSKTNTGSHKDVLLNSAKILKVFKGGKKMINAGYSWLETGLLRETLETLPGLTLYADGNCKEFEEILDNLLSAEEDRLLHRTTQIEAPLLLADTLQQYIDFSGKEKAIWQKYGPMMKKIIASYTTREEVSLCPDGLLWCQKFATALSWMNAYVNGHPVTERDGFQVEVNAMWYNALCFAIEMEEKYGPKSNAFVKSWSKIRDMARLNFRTTFLLQYRHFTSLADYVNNYGQHGECRPNMLWAVYSKYPLLEDNEQLDVMNIIFNELVTRRGVRTLSPCDNNYRGVYEGSQDSRDLAYHNGCTRSSLLGPLVATCYRMYGPSFNAKAKWLTEGFFEDENKHGVGYFSELYDGDPPHEPHGAIASATAAAALLRCLYLMDKYKEDNK